MDQSYNYKLSDFTLMGWVLIITTGVVLLGGAFLLARWLNLVAKEFVTARDDERSVLVLSKFTEAAQELTDSIPVNPFDVERLATACTHLSR